MRERQDEIYGNDGDVGGEAEAFALHNLAGGPSEKGQAELPWMRCTICREDVVDCHCTIEQVTTHLQNYPHRLEPVHEQKEVVQQREAGTSLSWASQTGCAWCPQPPLGLGYLGGSVVHLHDDGWWWYDETYADELGPFKTWAEANESVTKYAREVLG